MDIANLNKAGEKRADLKDLRDIVRLCEEKGAPYDILRGIEYHLRSCNVFNFKQEIETFARFVKLAAMEKIIEIEKEVAAL